MSRFVGGFLRGLVAVALTLALWPAASARALSSATFNLAPEKKLLKCFAASPSRPPKAAVNVQKGRVKDTLTIFLKNFKPGLNFDLFTVENSNLLPDGNLDPAFDNFGLAWYQSDIHVTKTGKTQVTIQTILVNQIFGFDPAASLPPTNTFHVGFWFNDPNDAAKCGFDPTKPTPFNGEHRAGPVAMISLPDGTTGLGPLCLNPNTSTVPATCNP